jgi:hypothetical protein
MTVLERRAQVDTHEEVEPFFAQELLAAYRAAFARLASLSPVRQVFTDDDFLADMANPAIVKFVARDAAGEICALSTLTNDLTTQPWLSPEYYACRYPIHFRERRLYYVGSLLVMPEHQCGPWASMLLTSVIRWLAVRRAIATFDCCSFNVEAVQLPRLVEAVTRREARGRLEELGRQHFYALVLDGAR